MEKNKVYKAFCCGNCKYLTQKKESCGYPYGFKLIPFCSILKEEVKETNFCNNFKYSEEAIGESNN